MIVHPVFNAINQLFKQSPSSIKSLMDVALSQSDSNGFNSKTVTMRLEQREWWEKKADAKQAINPFSKRHSHQTEDLETMNQERVCFHIFYYCFRVAILLILL